MILLQANIETADPFWRNISLITLSFLMFGGTLYLYIRLRSLTFRRIRRLLEERVEVKTRQLTEKNLELETLSLVASRTDNAVLMASPDSRVEWINDGFVRITGLPRETLIGKRLSDINVYPEIEKEVSEAITNRHSRIFESNVHLSSGKDIWLSSTLTPVFDEFQHLKKIVLVDTDITGIKKLQQQIEASLKEKDVLIKEIHHRVKNNLQIIISLLNLQSGYLKDEFTLKAVKDGQNRVRSMALVHEKFYQAEELSEINFNEYLEKLCHYLYQSYGDKTDRIELTVTGDKVGLDMDTAMPCGLLVNEIVSNSYKYAFPPGMNGFINLSLTKTTGKVGLKVHDSGIGLPNEFTMETAESLGMQLIQALTSQLDGELTISKDNGTTFEITFPYPKKSH
jgi:PAS domain S-box-containing protein